MPSKDNGNWQTKTNISEEISLLSEPQFTHFKSPHKLKNILGKQIPDKKPEALSVTSLFSLHSNLPQSSRHFAEGNQRHRGHLRRVAIPKLGTFSGLIQFQMRTEKSTIEIPVSVIEVDIF